MTTSAPARRYLATSAAVSTPVVAASEALHPSVQERDPRARQARLGRAREADLRHDGERVGVDVGLQEPVEEHERVGAGLVEPQRHLAGRAEVRAQLDRHRHASPRP